LEEAIEEALATAPIPPTASQFAAAKESVDAAERALTTAKDALQTAKDGVTQAKVAVTTAQQARARLGGRIGAVVPKAEIAFVPRLPASVTAVASSVGYATPAVLATLTPTDLVVQVSGLTGVGTGVVVEGSVVELAMPDGETRAGTVASVVPSAGEGLGGVDVTITPDDLLDVAIAGVNIKVTFVEAATAGEVLGVPQGAIRSDSSGELSVIVADEPAGADTGPSLHRVAVTTGVAGVDLIEVIPVEPGALAAGMSVVIGG
jgi:hypothetical protein